MWHMAAGQQEYNLIINNNWTRLEDSEQLAPSNGAPLLRSHL